MSAIPSLVIINAIRDSSTRVIRKNIPDEPTCNSIVWFFFEFEFEFEHNRLKLIHQ